MMKLNEVKERIVQKWDWSNNTDHGPIGALLVGALVVAPSSLLIGYFVIDFLARIMK